MKCELAKMKNKETCYKTLLDKRDALIVELDEKLENLEKQHAQQEKERQIQELQQPMTKQV